MIDRSHSVQQQDGFDAQPAQQTQQDAVGHDTEEAPSAASFAPMQKHVLAGTLADTRPLRDRVTTPPVELPHRAAIERSFGRPLPAIQAHVGEAALVRGLGALAAAEGNVIAFREPNPDLKTVAHEVTHVVQAVSGRSEGGAESEASHVEDNVAAGQQVGELSGGAAGVHLKEEAPLVDARGFLRESLSVSTIALHTLFMNKSLASHPYARYLSSADALLEGMLTYGKPGLGLLQPLAEKIEALVAPESIVTLVDNARRADIPAGAMVGPAHSVYEESVGFALGNALTRRLRESFTRMLPRYASAVALERNAEGKLVPTATPQPSWLTPSHPIDRLMAYGLCDPALKIDVEKFCADQPELVKAAQRATSRTVQVRLPYEKNLWHWIEATPADATAEEVATALFGGPEQAYRLTAMPPLFGFRGSDVAAFKKEKRDELNQLAAKHHPNPAILNWADLAQYDNEKDRRDRETNPWRNGTYGTDAMDGGVPPIAGVPPPPSNEPDLARPAEIKGYPADYDVDPAVELAAAMGDKYARDRANATADGKQHDEKAVYDALDNCLEALASTESAFTSLALSLGSLQRFRGEFQRRQRESLDACLADPNGMYALATQQAGVLKRISKGALDTSAHLALFGGVGSKDGGPLPSPNELPDAAREPIVEAANAYGSALDALALPELANPRVDQADVLKRTLRISILENSLHQTEPTLETALDTPDDRHDNTAAYDPKQKEQTNNNLLAELAILRVQTESDPAAAEKQLKDTQSRAGDHLFEMSVIANFEALDRVWKLVHDQHDFWESLPDGVNGALLESKNRTYYEQFKGIFNRFKIGSTFKNEPIKQTAKDDFKKLVEDKDFQDHFDTVRKHLENEASHKKWAKIIAGIVIAVVAMGLGQVYFGVLLAETGSVLLATVGGAAMETTTSAVLNKLVLDADPTAGNLITGFIGAGVMYYTIGRALTVAKAAGVGTEVAAATETANLATKAGRMVAGATKELLFAQAITLVQNEVASLIDRGRTLTEEEVSEMFVHGVAGLVGVKIGQRVIDVHLEPFKPLKQMGARNGIDISALIDQRQQLIDLAKQVELTRDPVLAQKLIETERAFLEHEQRIREKLIEFAKQHPDQVSAAKLKDLQAMPERSADPEVVKAAAQMSLEEVSPGYYRADAHAFDALIAAHKESGDRLVSVTTDEKTGLRTVKFQTPEGMQIRVKEKLPEAAERTPSPLPIEEATRFENWLDHEAPIVLEAGAIERMREYYARDPKAAVKLAGERYNYQQGITSFAPEARAPGIEHPAAKADVSDAARAYEQYQYEKSGERKTQSTVGEELVMNRSDFEAMYKNGFQYDPVAKKWVLGERTTATGSTGHSVQALTGGDRSEVLGTVHSEAVGEQVLRKLVAGEGEALRMVGIEPPKGFDSRTNEWGLARRKSDGAIVLVRGAKGEVNWSHVPEVEALAHSHPVVDPITGKVREITGKTKQGVIDASNALSLGATATHDDLVYFVPSTGDLRFVALGGKPHAVMTPFAHLGEGRVGNFTPGMNLDTVEIHIVSAEAVGLFGDMVVYKGKVRVMAGEKVIGSYDLYQTFHERLGDLPSFVEPLGTKPLPADHPITKLETTPTSRTEPIGHVQPNTVRHLIALGINDASPTVMAMLGGLDADGAAHLSMLAERAVEGRVEGLNAWIARAETLRGNDLRNAVLDLESAARAMEADPALRVSFGGEGRLKFIDAPKEAMSHAPADPPVLVKEVREAVAKEKPEDFEWTWSEPDALRVVAEGRKLGLSDTQIRDLIRIAQRRDQFPENAPPITKKISPDEMIQQMHNYVEVVLPQEHPYRIDSKAQFKEFGDEMRAAATRAGLPIDDIRIQGSALRNPKARDIDVAILIDDRIFDAQLVKTFEGTVRDAAGNELDLRIDTMAELARRIMADEKAGRTKFNSVARTFAYAYEHRTIRVQDLPALRAAKDGLAAKYGKLDITVMSNAGYLNREPFMMMP